MDTRFNWLSDYLARLEGEHLIAQRGAAELLAPAQCLILDPEDWAAAARIAAGLGMRHAGVWADAHEVNSDEYTANDDSAAPGMMVYAVLEYAGDYLVLKTRVDLNRAELNSHTPFFSGVNRLERHAQDLIGIRFIDHPDPRRWIRHQAWPDNQFPLRRDFHYPPASVNQAAPRTPADGHYPFIPIAGASVFSIPVGPVHAGIIEPGHFRFHAAGEDVLKLEEHLGYVHKGIEALAIGRDAMGLARLAARISGDSTVAHTWAACQALERATATQVPDRAQHLRALFAERERVANHLGDIGAICNDVGFGFAFAQCSRLRERWQRRSDALFGHRLLMDKIIPGGVALDLAADQIPNLRRDHVHFRAACVTLFDIFNNHPSLGDRLVTTGQLSIAQAQQLGCTGYVGKASGLGFDVRRCNPYSPYDQFTISMKIEQEGDVAARMRIRMREIRQSLTLMDQLLETLPEGAISIALNSPPTGGGEGLGMIDGWRGEIITFVRVNNDGRIARFFPRDPSWFTWPALEQLILGNIVPDFPVCNKSVNGSYSGVDL
ncbi:NADH-quinone oxidoreductase subunit C [Rhodoferax sp. 4810]|uniref:NADH-quinone oxidoreductase subunit C n=1 Tax=Thiospirillum jenense TaxID=1653858 RepID=A0A839HHQ6_9GAMM|nr:NADH-quinone oxidoreductase subunit C [Thiospirillum jenense]MBB1074564.1 NADH-quinone oxidoreductase subunit C [Rhodoferax jenense]MBB1126538.1 NADH-quinone oxidoreductase subunit C [Thiospirillum jenense]